MRYICKRCAYGTNIKCNLINHLTRKKPCISTHLDIPRETLIEELGEKIIEVNTKVNKKVNKKVNIVNTEGNICECKYC